MVLRRRRRPDGALFDLAVVARELVRQNLVLGTGGNVSLRDEDVMYISASRARLDELEAARFVLVHLDTGKAEAQPVGVPSSEWRMHVAAYQARPEARIVVHAHPTYCITYSCGHDDLCATTPDFVVHFGYSVPVVPYVTPTTAELAEQVNEALTRAPAVLLRNHGLLVTAETVGHALTRTLLLEESAKIAVLAGKRFKPLSKAHVAALEALLYGDDESASTAISRHRGA